MERQPAVAGTFYPKDPKRLREMASGFMKLATPDIALSERALAYVAPHAGYLYSGAVAGFTYSAIAGMKRLGGISTFVIIGPNHTGYGAPMAISELDWRTPLGVVGNDLEFSRELGRHSDLFSADDEAHRFEHSIEVQLPFLQSVVEKPRCAFVCMGDQSEEAARLLASGINNTAKRLKRSVLVIASSDLDHYETEKIAAEKDRRALAALERLDVHGFEKSLQENRDSACGHGPISAAALCAKGAGAYSGTVMKYANSGEVTKDYGSVVAYASIVFTLKQKKNLRKVS